MSKEVCNHGTNYGLVEFLWKCVGREPKSIPVIVIYVDHEAIFQSARKRCIYVLFGKINFPQGISIFHSCHKYQTILWYMTEDRNLLKISNVFWWVWRWCARIETTFITETSRKGNMEKELRGKLANVSGRRNELSLRIQLFQQFSWEYRTTGPLSPLSSPPLSRNARCSVNADRCEREASCGEISCRETLAFINIHRELFVERNS